MSVAGVPALHVLSVASLWTPPRLKVSGTDLMYNGKKVFLSGCNIAYNNYDYDFGNGYYDGTIEDWIREISEAGGNSIRVFVHTEGHNTPTYGDYGYVTACDTTGDFINDVYSLLNVAKSYNVLVVLVMFNAAHLEKTETLHLIWDDSKLDSYIEHCLTPLIEKIKGHPAVAAFEAINEPEGSVKVEYNSQPCYDTSPLSSQGPNWTGLWIPMQKLLRFIGRLNQAVRAVDPDMLTTIGSWSQFPQNDVFVHSRNYYKDECLNLAAGGPNAHIDFYQMHSYAWKGAWTPNAPFTRIASDYGLDKPLVIGECSSAASAGQSLNSLFEYAYETGYNGVWSWHFAGTNENSDTRCNQIQALGHLEGRTDYGFINFIIGMSKIKEKSSLSPLPERKCPPPAIPESINPPPALPEDTFDSKRYL